MTRQNKTNSGSYLGSFLSSLGSITKNVKRVAVLSALLFSCQMREAEADEAQYRVKVHKQFMKEVLEKNFPVVLKHIESLNQKNKYLAEINANIDAFSMRIVPKEKNK